MEENQTIPQDVFSSYNRDVLGIKPEENGQKEGVQASEEVDKGNLEASTTEVPPPPPAQETKKDTAQETVVPPQETDWFAIQKFNERFGTELQTEEEIKEAIRSLSENKDYLGKKDYYSQLEQEFAQVNSSENLTKVFGSKENFERFAMLQSLAQQMPESVANAILTTDLNKVDNLQAMFLEAVSRDPNLLSSGFSEQDIKKAILNRVGVDVSDPDFDIDKYQEAAKTNPRMLIDLSMGATQAKNYFKGLTEEARKSIPEIKDFKQEFEQRSKERAEVVQKRTNEWTMKAKDLAVGFKEFKIMDKDAQGKDVVDFTFTVPKDFQDNVANYLVEWAVKNGVDLTPETVAQAQTEIQDAFEDTYKAEIRKAYKDEKLAKYKEELDNKVHNNKPINTQEAPPEHANSYKDELDAQRKQFGLI